MALAPSSQDALHRQRRQQRRRSDDRADPFDETWHCSGYAVSPSLFRMVCADTGEVVELTRKQAQFVALLLGSRDAAGVPLYLRREMTRRVVFAADAQCRDYDNDIDRLVKFFRQYLGREAIGRERD